MMKCFLALVFWGLGVGFIGSVYAGLDEAIIKHMKLRDGVAIELEGSIAASSVNETAEEEVDNGLAVLAALPTAASSGASTSGWVELSEEERLNVNKRGKRGRTALHWAVAERNLGKVIALLSVPKIEVDSMDGLSETPLHEAARIGHLAILEALINAGARGGTFRYTPLHEAAYRGHVNIVKALIKAPGVNIDAEDYRTETPLFVAINRRHFEVAEVLINEGANLNIEAVTMYTPLTLAATFGQLKVVQLLIGEGADVMFEKRYGQLALHMAIESGHSKVAKELIATKVGLEHKDLTDFSPLRLAAKYGRLSVIKLLILSGVEVDAKDYEGRTALHYAAKWSHLEAVKALIAAGADWNARDRHGKTPLEWVLEEPVYIRTKERDGGREDVIRFLNRVDENQKKAEEEKRNQQQQKELKIESGEIASAGAARAAAPATSVETKAGRGRRGGAASSSFRERGNSTQEASGAMASRGRGKTMRGGKGKARGKKRGAAGSMDETAKARMKSALPTATSRSAPRELVSKEERLNVNKRDFEGKTALHRAAEDGNLEKAKALLEIPEIEVDAEDRYGRTALELACRRGYVEIFQALAAKWPRRMLQWMTPLHIATFCRDLEAVKAVLEMPETYVDHKDRYGRTALWIAGRNEDYDIARLIEGKSKEERERKEREIADDSMYCPSGLIRVNGCWRTMGGGCPRTMPAALLSRW